MSDAVFIEGLEVYAYHGLSDEEQGIGHIYRFDIWLYTDTRPTAASDSIKDAVDYKKVSDLIVAETTGHKSRLVETLAERVAAKLFEAFPQVEDLRLNVSKMSPPLGAIAEAAGVEIVRSR